MYRDDGEAARARADALQRELDEKDRKLADAERKLASAETRLAERGAPLKPWTSTPLPQTTSDETSDPPYTGGGWGVIVGSLAVLAIVVGIAYTLRRSSEPEEPPNPTCTLRTEPPGAEIVAVCQSPVGRTVNADLHQRLDKRLAESGVDVRMPMQFEMHRGMSPISLSRLSWIAQDVTCHGTMVARLKGYRDAPVTSPLAGMGCSSDVLRLERE